MICYITIAVLAITTGVFAYKYIALMSGLKKKDEEIYGIVDDTMRKLFPNAYEE